MSDGCGYCKQSPDIGDVDVLKIKLGMGFAGSIEIGASLCNTKGEPFLMSLWAWHEEKEGGGDILESRYIKINYCPFCGRKLREGD